MFNMMSEAGKQAAVRCWASNTCLMIPGNNLGLFQRSLRGSSWNIIFVNFYSMHQIIVTTTIQGQDAFTLDLIYSLPYPSEVCIMTFILWRRTEPLKLIINDSNDYLCSLSTITVPRALHMWTHRVLTSTFWRRFCYDSQARSWNIQWLNNLVMSHGWWWRNSTQTKVIQLWDPVLALAHSGYEYAGCHTPNKKENRNPDLVSKHRLLSAKQTQISSGAWNVKQWLTIGPRTHWRVHPLCPKSSKF